MRPRCQAHIIFSIYFCYFSTFAILLIYLLLLCPRGYPISRKTFESSHQTSLSILTWPFRDDISIPAFSVFFFLPHTTLFFPHTPRPIRSPLRLQYSPNRICQLLLDRFLFVFFRPDPPADFYVIFYKCPVVVVMVVFVVCLTYLSTFYLCSTSKSASSTSKHQDRGGQTLYLTSKTSICDLLGL